MKRFITFLMVVVLIMMSVPVTGHATNTAEISEEYINVPKNGTSGFTGKKGFWGQTGTGIDSYIWVTAKDANANMNIDYKFSADIEVADYVVIEMELAWEALNDNSSAFWKLFFWNAEQSATSELFQVNNNGYFRLKDLNSNYQIINKDSNNVMIDKTEGAYTKIAFAINLTGKTADIYIDDVLVSDDFVLPSTNESLSIGGFRIHAVKSNSSGETLYTRTVNIKNFCVYEGTEPRDINFSSSFNDKKYESLQDAITDANTAITDGTASSVEIDLLSGVTASSDITVNENVTLDLNGYTLDMATNSCYLTSNGNVVDNSTDKTGRLKIDTYAAGEIAAGNELSIGTPKAKLAANNSQMPVYIEGEGYMLATMTAQAEVNAKETDYFTTISRPSFGSAHVGKLQDGATKAGLQFILRLDWTGDKDGTTKACYQEFKYSDDLVESIYTNGTAFSVTVSGLTNYASTMTVKEYVKSDLGVELLNNSFSMAEKTTNP